MAHMWSCCYAASVKQSNHKLEVCARKSQVGLRAEGFEFNPCMQANKRQSGGDADPAGPTPTTSTSMTHMVHILN